jgi:ankyrin repeat protein
MSTPVAKLDLGTVLATSSSSSEHPSNSSFSSSLNVECSGSAKNGDQLTKMEVLIRENQALAVALAKEDIYQKRELKLLEEIEQLKKENAQLKQITCISNEQSAIIFKYGSEERQDILGLPHPINDFLLLCERNMNSKKINLEWEEQVFKALSDLKNIAELKSLVKKFNVNARIFNGKALVHLASECHTSVQLKILVKLGEANINLLSDEGWSPLMYASRKGSWMNVEYLLEHSDIKLNVAKPYTALQLAELHNHPKIHKLIKQKVLELTNKLWSEIIQQSTSDPAKQINKKNILEQQRLPTSDEIRGFYTSQKELNDQLIFSSVGKKMDVILILLNLGADLTYKNIDNMNFLHLVAWLGHLEVAKMIVDKAPRLLLENCSRGFFPVDYVKMNPYFANDSKELMKFLNFMIKKTLSVDEDDKLVLEFARYSVPEAVSMSSLASFDSGPGNQSTANSCALQSPWNCFSFLERNKLTNENKTGLCVIPSPQNQKIIENLKKGINTL